MKIKNKKDASLRHQINKFSNPKLLRKFSRFKYFQKSVTSLLKNGFVDERIGKTITIKKIVIIIPKATSVALTVYEPSFFSLNSRKYSLLISKLCIKKKT